ncbi:podocalyxin-like protein 2 [Hyla sarda]|uniref:podocalyxin-like protein 2 n=1 Tax=Hyla sarda TaxID=327740 RepID=UPI0024C2BC1A|nr:podocalyxin-like protein 2 [Hyla sarda]XP_056380836.1 podocalyxin-like protein 2 [Hyla sarda]
MLQAWHILLGISYFLLVSCDDSHSEGLSSTSILDDEANLEIVCDHGCDRYHDTDNQHTSFNRPQGSGFSSQETEEISIFQSPKYFWDDETRKSNLSSDDSGAQTDGPDTTNIYGVNQEETTGSSLPKESVETSTTLWSTAIEEISKPVTPNTNVPEKEGTIQMTAQSERTAPSPNNEERTLSKMVITSSVRPTTKPSRKNRKHSWSKNHHISHDQESESRPGPPADSWGLPGGHSLAGPGYHEDESLSTQSLHIANEEGKIRFSNQRDKNPTKPAVPSEVSHQVSHQVICKDWINLAGKNYVILNMSDDIDCEEFRWQRGQHLLSLLEGALAWKTDPPQRDWVIFLSKPNENDNHLLMTVTDEERVVPVKDVFTALGDIKRSLAEIGIESYSSTVSCQSRPSPPRSDYGKLFIVLVIIGSICVMIIIAGLIYICWQRRLPKLKNMELHFVENGCHDNPTLDVAMDGQSEMQEKKTSLNGGTSHRADGWETLINKTSKDETDTMEEDTHL